MIQASIPAVIKFADGADALVCWWSECPSKDLAYATDLWALGDVQPQLYVLAQLCRRFGHEELADAAFSAAAQAKKIWVLLFGLRRLEPVPPYDLCRADIALLGDRLRAVAEAARAVTGPSAVTADGPAGAWLRHRLDALSYWHFGTRLG